MAWQGGGQRWAAQGPPTTEPPAAAHTREGHSSTMSDKAGAAGANVTHSASSWSLLVRIRKPTAKTGARRPRITPSSRRCGARASPRRRPGPKRGLGPAEHSGREPGANPSAGDESGACAQECGPLRGCGRGVPSSPRGGNRRLGHSAGRSGLRQARGCIPGSPGESGLVSRGRQGKTIWTGLCSVADF